MHPAIEELLDQAENEGNSASLAFADHLKTVASNGPEYATTESMIEEAEAIAAAAAAFIILAKRLL